MQYSAHGTWESANVPPRSESGGPGTPIPLERFGFLWPGLKAPPDGFHFYPARREGFVLIAGLGRAELPARIAQAAEQLGRTLAACGFGLIAGGWPGVDAVVTQAFVERLAVWGVPAEEWLTQILEPKREPLVRAGRLQTTASVDESIRASVAGASAVVCLSGEGGTARIGRMALDQGVPVFPLSRTDGDARVLYQRLRSTRRDEPAPGLTWDEFTVLEQEPLKAIARLPDLLRKSLAHRSAKQASTREASKQKSEPPRTEPEAVLGIANRHGQVMMTGFIVAEPRVIVTDGFARNTDQLHSHFIQVQDSMGRNHGARVLRRDLKHPFGPLVLSVPDTLSSVKGFELRNDGLWRRRGHVHISMWQQAGFQVVTGTIETFREETVDIAPVGEVQNLVRIHADVHPGSGSSGAPVLDSQGRVCGFIVAGGGTNLAFCYPTTRWAGQLTAEAEPASRPAAEKILSKKTPKKPALKRRK